MSSPGGEVPKGLRPGDIGEGDVAGSDVAGKAARAIDAIAGRVADGELVAVAFSGGKDSSVVLGLALQGWLQARASGAACYPLLVISGDTGIENPVVAAALRENHAALRAFADRRGVALEIEIAQPTVADRYLVQIISGRSLPTFVNAANRNCAVSLKVTPGTRAVKAARDRIVAASGQRGRAASPLVLVGSRLDESAARNRNMNAAGIADGRDADSGLGTRTYAPIAAWSSDDVWEWLACAGAEAQPPFLAWRASFDETVELYRDASGECPVVVGDRGPRAACGARHGCVLCTASGERDRSVERMLALDRHAHLRGLNALRNWLANSQYRWDLRARVRRRRLDGRDVIGLGAGTYSPAACAQLLAMCLSLDRRERERAAALRADLDAGGAGDAYLAAQVRDGRPIDRAYGARMVEPQFELIDLESLIAIDFYWSINAMQPPFEALRIYRDVMEGDGAMDVPALEPGDPAGRPPEREIAAPELDGQEGLRDHAAEFVMPEAARPCWQGGAEVMAHAQARVLTVDLEAAQLWVAFELDQLVDAHADQKPFAAAAFYLRNGIVALPRGRGGVMHGIAKRGQWLFEHAGW